jgi:uroporphyrinogen-III decarboxylase
VDSGHACDSRYPMNNRERILKLLAGQKPDRVPWFGDLDYWANAMEQRGDLPPGFTRSRAYFDLNRELGVGFYLQGYFPFKTVYDFNVNYEKRWVGNARHERISTPVGTLTSRWEYLPESFSEAPVEHFVKCVADLATLRYVYEHTAYLPDYDELARRQPFVGDNGVLLVYLQRSPFMQMVTELVGIVTIVQLYVDAPDELDATLRLMEHSHDAANAIALNAPADCYMIPENLSSEVVGRRFYERYLRPYETGWVQRIREAGKYSFIHMDGTLKGLLREVASVGFDVVEAATPAPVGDLTFEQMRQLAGPAQILWGGIPGIYFTDLVDDAEFERLVRDILGMMTREPRYVLGVADQVPPGGLRRRVGRVAELVQQYGAYQV